MEKLCYVICGNYKKFEKPKISHIFEKMLVALLATSARMKLKI